MDKLNFDKIRNAVDDIKNKVLAENDSERRVCEALSNKNWGASSTLMNDIARDTYDFQMYGPIMSILWSALEAPKREWRKVFKALGLLEHLIKNGTELVVEDSRDRIYRLRALTSFSYYEAQNDKGSGIREKAKQLLDLLKDNEYIREERKKAHKLRNKFVGVGGGVGSYSDYAGGGGGGYYNDSYNRGGGGGYQDRRDTYNRSNRSPQSRGEVSSTGRYRDSTHMDYDRNERYQEKYARDDNDDGEKHSSTSTAHSSKQNVKKHGSKRSVLTKDPPNIDKTTVQQSTTATHPPSGGRKGEDLLGAENDFADFSNAPPVTQNTVTSQVVTPEEDEWDAFKSSSPTAPTSAPAVEAKAAQPLSDIYQGGNSALPEPPTLLAEMPPEQQISQHTDNPFDMLSMRQRPTQVPLQQHQQLSQRQQQAGFGSTGPDGNSAVGRRPSTNSSGDVQEWGSYLTSRSRMSFTGSVGDFQAAPSNGGSTMSSIGKKGGMDDNGVGDLSSLVNLGGLQTNDLQREQSMDGKNELFNAGRTTSSFRGLDEFFTQPQGTVPSLDPNMNSGGSSQCGLNMRSPASSGYSVQQQPRQPQQYEIPKGMSAGPHAGATGLPQQQMPHSGQWPVIGNPSIQQPQPGMMGSRIPRGSMGGAMK